VTQGITRRNALTGAALVGVAVPTLAACGGDHTPTSQAPTTSTPSGSATSPSSTSGGAAGGFATTADVPVGSGAVFADEGVVVTQPTEGTFKGFTNICTHQGCPMRDVTTTINCSCHGSQFSIEDGTNVTGPSGSPGGTVNDLPEVALEVKGNQISKA